MCEREPLPRQLMMMKSYSNLGFSLYNTKGPISLITRKIPVNTGSGAIIFKLKFVLKNKEHYAVAKVHSATSNSRKIAGLIHEKQVYEFLNTLVDSNICPFFLRSYIIDVPNINVGNNVLITESFSAYRFTTMNKFLKSRPTKIKTVKDSVNFLLMLLYTIEVMYRVGLRHNDMHLNNIFLLHCPSTTYEIKYVARDGRMFTFFLYDVNYIPLFFDNDRATKLDPKPYNVTRAVTFHQAHVFTPKSHEAVTARFHWHNPQHRTEKLDLYKLMQHIRDTVIDTSPLYSIIRNTCYSQKSKIHCLSSNSNTRRRAVAGLQKSAFRNYHLPLNKKNANGTEIIPHWSGTSEKFFFLLTKMLKKERIHQKTTLIDMRKLYN